MLRRSGIALWVALVVHCLTTPSSAQSKLAIVVGVDSYSNFGPERQLQRAVADSRSMATTLRELGFDVLHGENVTRSQFSNLWQTFLDRLNPSDTTALYFSGHGVEIEGLNFLLPSDMPLINYGRQEQMKREALSVTEFLLDLRRRSPRVSLVILDACRDNPFVPNGLRVVGSRGGLARIDAPAGSFIMYSAGAGQTALDRLPAGDTDSRNSVFTRKLLPLLKTQGLSLPELARRVRLEVSTLANTVPHLQTPAYYDGLIGQYCLAGCSAPPRKNDQEELSWIKAEASNRLSGYQAYLRERPSGAHAGEAAKRIRHLHSLNGSWEALRAEKDLTRLRGFLAQSAGTEFARLVSVRIMELEALEAAAWGQVENRKKYIEYKRFLESWPGGVYADAARQRLQELDEIRGQWEKIKNDRDEAALEEFVLKSGWTEFGADATALLAALKRGQSSRSPQSVMTLNAKELRGLMDGKSIKFDGASDQISFGSRLMPSYRKRLGSGFLGKVLSEDIVVEGAFHASSGTTKIEGIGSIVKSKVDGTGSVFLLQMHGSERTRKDVDRDDRLFKTFQVVKDKFGYVCITTGWHRILASTKPAKTAERCIFENVK
ncbi:MAG: caspase family protein [Hyphomicrobiaceae bacterium]